MNIPTVQDIDDWHDSGALGDLYIWCQKLREELVTQRSAVEGLRRQKEQQVDRANAAETENANLRERIRRLETMPEQEQEQEEQEQGEQTTKGKGGEA